MHCQSPGAERTLNRRVFGARVVRSAVFRDTDLVLAVGISSHQLLEPAESHPVRSPLAWLWCLVSNAGPKMIFGPIQSIESLVAESSAPTRLADARF
jgi:hypothetical protein